MIDTASDMDIDRALKFNLGMPLSTGLSSVAETTRDREGIDNSDSGGSRSELKWNGMTEAKMKECKAGLLKDVHCWNDIYSGHHEDEYQLILGTSTNQMKWTPVRDRPDRIYLLLQDDFGVIKCGVSALTKDMLLTRYKNAYGYIHQLDTFQITNRKLL